MPLRSQQINDCVILRRKYHLPTRTRPAKRAKTAVSDRSQPLTAEILERHTLREGYFDTLELMGLEAGKGSGSKRSKRSASQVGISISGDLETVSHVTQKSSLTAAHYRNSVLEDVNVCFPFRRAPEDIRTRITTIVQAEVSLERKEELSLIAQKLQDRFARDLGSAVGQTIAVSFSGKPFLLWATTKVSSFEEKPVWWLY